MWRGCFREIIMDEVQATFRFGVLIHTLWEYKLTDFNWKNIEVILFIYLFII